MHRIGQLFEFRMRRVIVAYANEGTSGTDEIVSRSCRQICHSQRTIRLLRAQGCLKKSYVNEIYCQRHVNVLHIFTIEGAMN